MLILQTTEINIRKAANMSRNVGNSILPSNCARILQPVETPFGVLQVRVIDTLDTHGLFWKHGDYDSLIAMHPNGYSCRALLDRMASGDVKHAQEQHGYILACGGLAGNAESIANVMRYSA